MSGHSSTRVGEWIARRPNRVAIEWLLPIVSVGAAVLLKGHVAWLARDPDLLLLLAVMAAASLGGLGPGLFATAIAALAQLRWFMQPTGSFLVEDSGELATLGVWTLEGVFVSAIAGRMRAARDRAIVSAAEAARHGEALGIAQRDLEEKVAARTSDLEKANADLRAEVGQRTRFEAALGLAEVAVRAAYHVLQNLTEGCQVIGPDWTYLYVNEAAAKQGKLLSEQLVGRTMMVCFPGIETTPMFRTLKKCMQERVHDQMENDFLFRDGTQGVYGLRFVPVPEGVCILSTDITHRRKLEDQARQTQKMEAVGRLAGGIAHDFNNLLSIILSYASMTVESLPENDPLREDVLEIEHAGQRAAELTGQLLAFSRQQVLAPTIIDLNALLARLQKMLARLLGEDIDLRAVLGPGLGRVHADAGQIEQIIMNLAVNARDAMPSGGHLTIETDNVDLDEEYVRTHLGTTVGPHVMLAVSDTGQGMSAATQALIFEPFFTTKEVGKGTGLGLATVLGIVQQSGGSIWVYSEEGRGTTFKTYFPRADQIATEVPIAPAALPRAARETILLVEDEEHLRALILGILEKRGYRVLCAASPVEALATALQFRNAIDLLLTDVVMPGMNGRELAERLSADRPAMRVLYMSGYTGEVVVHHGVLDRGSAFLAKPITPAALLRKVAEVLDGPEAAHG